MKLSEAPAPLLNSRPAAAAPLPIRAARPRAFALLESMVGVAVFAIGVLALGASVNNCLRSEQANTEDQRARLALENCMREIESGAKPITESSTEALDGMFTGITLKEASAPLNAKNEKNQDLSGLTRIDLEADWKSGARTESKAIFFYVLHQG